MLFHFNESVGRHFQLFIENTHINRKVVLAWVVLNEIENCILIEYSSKCYYLYIFMTAQGKNIISRKL